MKPRKIAFVSPMYFHDQSYIGGGERYPLTLAQGIVASSEGRYEVEIISYGAVSKSVELDRNLTLRVLKQANAPHNPADSLSWEIAEALFDADLVHIHQAFTRSSEVALLVAKQLRKPICMTDHGGTTSTLASSLGSLELADRVICYSRFAASLLKTQTPVEVIKGGVDAEFFSPAPGGNPRTHFLYVGRLMPHKGIDRLIAAMPADLPLIVCGRAHELEYRRMLEGLARTKSVRFVTDADDHDIRDFYRSAWATILPSVYRDCYGRTHLAPELMGLTLLESMACGTPAICSRVGGMPEFIDDGSTGFVFDELATLTSNLRLLSSDPSLVEEMGLKARASIDSEFDLKKVSPRFVELYDDLLHTGAGAANPT